MRTIHKYPLVSSGVLQMPTGAKILDIEYQDRIPHVWAEIDTDQPDEPRAFVVIPTGEPFPEGNLSFIKSIHNPPFVWHLYELLVPEEASNDAPA